MHAHRDRSIRQKLIRIVFIACGVAVLLACSGFALYDILAARHSMAEDLGTLADIVGSNSSAALTFRDWESAHQTLASLTVKPHIVEACIYLREGSVFDCYHRPGSDSEAPPPSFRSEGASVASGYMHVFRLIHLDGEEIGSIYLKSDLTELYLRAARFAGIMLLVLLVSLLTAFLLATRLQRVISEPILELARTVFSVSNARDYSVRATKRSNDEIGFLYDRFNEMLDQIQQRDTELVWARDELEQRVEERTRELQNEVSVRKKAETALEERKSFLNSVIEHSPVAIAVVDTKGFLQLCNPAFETLFQYQQSDILGRSFAELLTTPELRGDIESNLADIHRGEPTHVVTRRCRSNSSIVDVEAYGVPLGPQGHITGLLVLYQDITERKEAEEALVRAKEAAEAASRAKSEFLANMSHEIRTPMNGIIGMTGLVLDTRLTAEQREYLGMVKNSADSLLTLINDILDFSKIEAGKLELEAIDFSLRESLGETMKALGLRAHQRGLELAWRVADAVPDSLNGDRGRLRQVLVNLVGNAVKFTERGEVVVNVDLESESEGGVPLHFAVKDTGIGIAREKQRAVFEPFEQADGSTTRKYGGTGLGLAITSQIVELMGGKIWVESELSHGSTFHFTARFELSKISCVLPRPVDPDFLRHSSVLVVDDNRTNRIILIEQLTKWGLRVESAPNAQAALAALQHAYDDRRRLSLVITDLHMPVVDGLGLVKEIRRNPLFGLLPVILLSSSPESGERIRSRQLGISAFLTKPIQPSELLDAVMNAVADQQADEAPTPPLVPPPRERKDAMKVLLAEDNAVNRTLAKKLLEKQGHSVIVAENGREVLALLERESVDLVLMDVQMPELDGLEATAAIREKEKVTAAHLPIIALTAHAMKGDRERCLAAGADAYVTKPIHPPELFAALDSFKPRKSGDVESPSMPVNEPPASSFDLTAALQHVDGDRELLEEIIRVFTDESPRMIADLRRAFDAGDPRLVERQSHMLKGSSSNLGATAVSRSAADVEAKARAGDLPGARSKLENLEREVKALLAELESLTRKVAH